MQELYRMVGAVGNLVNTIVAPAVGIEQPELNASEWRQSDV